MQMIGPAMFRTRMGISESGLGDAPLRRWVSRRAQSILLSAAYVSGYLRTISPPGRLRLQGADATHAWVSLWRGEGRGWIGLDPTNDLLVENDHIVLAEGRDFSDVSPVDGIIVGSREQKLGVAVDVMLVECRKIVVRT
jgi:transglutaminase-like putative cysteine protease